MMPVTLAEIVQVAPAPMEPPESARLFAPATAVTVPPQVDAPLGVDAMVTPDGSVSVSDAFVSAIAPDAVFANVTVSTDVPPVGIVVGENALLSAIGGAIV